ncbi:MAG: METTL5 family protein [Promethearchaeota archaeon]
MSSQKKLVSRKKLEMLLQNLQMFIDPKPDLEQYPITPRGASLILSIISNTYNDIQNKTIADLGCGTGILAIGAALLGAKQVIGVDIDPKQLEIATQNAKQLNLTNKIKWLELNIQNFSTKVDVVIQNPPFGVQQKDRGMDIIFLKKAIEIANIIYTVHKSGKKNQLYLQNIIQSQNALVDAIIPIQIFIPHLFNFHKKKQYAVEIDLYRIKI